MDRNVPLPEEPPPFPRKGGPGITRSDLLIINKTDLAPHVGVSLEVMERDSERMRRGAPFVMADLRHGKGIEAIAAFIVREGGLRLTPAAAGLQLAANGSWGWGSWLPLEFSKQKVHPLATGNIFRAGEKVRAAHGALRRSSGAPWTKVLT